MQHEILIEPATGLLKETFTGTMDLDSIAEADTAIMEHPDFRSGLNFLTDLRNAEIPFNFDKVLSLVSTIPSFQINRQAFIAEKDREYGMIRVFLGLAEGRGIFNQANVFRSLEEGLQWLTS